MDDIRALVVRNDLNLPAEKVSDLTNLLAKRSISYLSPDREAGPFMLFLCGDSLETISLKTNLPKDIIILTAIQYKWDEKANTLQKGMTELGTQTLQKEMAKSMLVATYIAVQKQLGDVISGRVSPAECPLIPKNIQSLEKLMTMISNITAPPEAKPGTTNVSAQNVQIVQNAIPASPEDLEAKRKERELMAKAIEGA